MSHRGNPRTSKAAVTSFSQARSVTRTLGQNWDFSRRLRNLGRCRCRRISVPLGSCLPTGFFPVLWILCEHLGRRDGIANQRGLFQSASSWCCWPVSELTSTSRACAGSEGRNIIGGAPCPTSNFVEVGLPNLDVCTDPSSGHDSPHTCRRPRCSAPTTRAICSARLCTCCSSASLDSVPVNDLESANQMEEERPSRIGCALPA